MSNIKFRVWCKHFNEWEKDEILIDKYGTILHWGKSGLRMVSPETHIVQRGTGMKDVNGKEIFEGDIIKVHADKKYPLSCEHIEGVIFSRGAFRPSNGLGNISDNISLTEIIGNIFENPDLIK